MLSENHTKCIEFYSDYGIKSTFVLYRPVFSISIVFSELVLVILSFLSSCMFLFLAHEYLFFFTNLLPTISLSYSVFLHFTAIVLN